MHVSFLWFGGALALHLWAAFFTEGFYHVDEHFQVLEFLAVKLGYSLGHTLPWEYAERLRTWALPGTLYLIVKPLVWLGVKNPFIQVLVFRLVSAIVSWLGLIALYAATHEWIDEKWRRRYPAMLALLWFLPFLQARVSSENWSAAFFLFGLALFAKQRHFAWAGFLMGIAFEFRYQTGLAVAFIWLWGVVVARRPAARMGAFAVGVLAAMALGAGIDRWGYGEWVSPPWNYFNEQILHHGAVRFGIEPWYAFGPWILRDGGFPLSLLLLVAPLTVWVKYPRHLLTWATLPYVAIHCLVSHKELRFLFPLAPLLPLCIALADIPLKRWVQTALAVENCLLLAIISTRPARTEISFRHEMYRQHVTQVFYPRGTLAPLTFGGMKESFYRANGETEVPFETFAEFETIVARAHNPVWLFTRTALGAEAGALKQRCQLHFSETPRWVETWGLTSIFARFNVRAARLYRCGGG